MEETITGLIDSVRSINPPSRIYGMVSFGMYSLLFTNARIIVAESISTKNYFSKALGISGAITVLGGGVIFGSQAISQASLNASKENTEKIKKLNIDEILKSSNKNFSIPFEAIQKITIKPPRYILNIILFDRGGLTIFTKDKKYLFMLYDNRVFDTYLKVLKAVLPNKLET
jgi:hypothetical protein